MLGLLVTQLACETAAPTVAESNTNAAFEAVAEEGADFLDLLHEEGFESGATGRQPVVAEEAAPEPPAEAPAAAPGAGAAATAATPDDEDLFSFEFGEEEAEPASALGDEPETEPAAGLPTRCRELLGRLAAGRAAIDGREGPLEDHRAALGDLLASCEELVRCVLEEPAETSDEREPASIGGRR